MNSNRTYTITFNGMEFEGCTLQTLDEAKDEAKKIRESAPDKKTLSGRTADIDDLIEALQEAKAEGVDTVKVNDDGRTRHIKPRITNNKARYYGHKPKPTELIEWVEL